MRQLGELDGVAGCDGRDHPLEQIGGGTLEQGDDLAQELLVVAGAVTPQHVHFGARTLPVFGRESIERQGLDAEPGAGFHRVANRVHTGFVPRHARQIAVVGPAAIAVHDNCDVRGQARRIDG